MKDFLESVESEIDRLLAHIRRRVDSPEEAEDIMQEAFLALYGRWSLRTPIRNATRWLLRVAGNKIVDWYRRSERRPVSLDAQARPADPDASVLWELADARVTTPQEEAERRELREALTEAIEALPDEQREAFLLTEAEGLTFREIEARTGAPLNTLLSRKRYAVLKLRKSLRDKFGVDEEK